MNQFKKDIKFKKSALVKDCFDFFYKEHIRGTIAVFNDTREVNIQFIESRYAEEGFCQKFIKEFKKNCEKNGFKLVSSCPISEAWRHIAKKFDLKIYE